MAPTPCRTLGATGRRPAVGTSDCKHPAHACAVVDVVTAAPHAKLVGGPEDAGRGAGQSKVRRPPETSAAHLRHVGRADPGAEHKRAVRLIDDAPWHAGRLGAAARAADPHLGLGRRPSSSPQRGAIARSWRPRWGRGTGNRQFATRGDLGRSLRASPCSYRTVRGGVRSLVVGCYAPPVRPTASAGS